MNETNYDQVTGAKILACGYCNNAVFCNCQTPEAWTTFGVYHYQCIVKFDPDSTPNDCCDHQHAVQYLDQNEDKIFIYYYYECPHYAILAAIVSRE